MLLCRIKIGNCSWYFILFYRVLNLVLWRSPSTRYRNPLKLANRRSLSYSRCGSDSRASLYSSLRTKTCSLWMSANSRNSSPSCPRKRSELRVRVVRLLSSVYYLFGNSMPVLIHVYLCIVFKGLNKLGFPEICGKEFFTLWNFC